VLFCFYLNKQISQNNREKIIKPVIRVEGLPSNLTEEKFREILRGIVKAVESVEEFGLKGEESMIIRFPRDMMTEVLATEITIEGHGFPESQPIKI